MNRHIGTKGIDLGQRVNRHMGAKGLKDLIISSLFFLVIHFGDAELIPAPVKDRNQWCQVLFSNNQRLQ